MESGDRIKFEKRVAKLCNRISGDGKHINADVDEVTATAAIILKLECHLEHEMNKKGRIKKNHNKKTKEKIDYWKWLAIRKLFKNPHLNKTSLGHSIEKDCIATEYEGQAGYISKKI